MRIFPNVPGFHSEPAVLPAAPDRGGHSVPVRQGDPDAPHREVLLASGSLAADGGLPSNTAAWLAV